MANRKKKHQLWLVNRIFLKLVLFLSKYVYIAAYKVLNAAVTTTIHKIAPKVAKQFKNTAKKGSNKLEPSNEELTPLNMIQGSYDDFSRSLASRSSIILIFGKRGSGKSALGFRLLENIYAKTKRPCFVLGVDYKLLPAWISEIKEIENVKGNGIVLIDEGAIAFSSRESMKKGNVTLGKMLATARHKDLTLIFITQNTGMIDKNVLNLTDVVIGNEISLLQKQMERPALRQFIEKADAAFKNLANEERINHCYIFSDDFEGLCSVTLPSFWSGRISKSRA
jgi:hypothetical protein